MTIHSKTVQQYFTALLFFAFKFIPVCCFENVINFGLGTVRSERVKLEAAVFAPEKY